MRGIRLKLDVQGEGGGRILGVGGQGGGSLENWTIFMDVYVYHLENTAKFHVMYWVNVCSHRAKTQYIVQQSSVFQLPNFLCAV